MIILQVPLHLLYFFSGFPPRNNKIWLFGCWGGSKFRGNSKLFYLFVREYCPEIRAVWITKSDSVYRELVDSQLEVYRAYSLQGTILTLRARFFFVTHGVLDMNQFVSRNGIIINLSHAIFPIKDMRRIPESCSLIRRAYLYLTEPYGYLINPDFAITSSDFTADATKHHYKVRESQIIATGTPKTDFLASLDRDQSVLLKGTSSEFDLGTKKLILFLPTIRPEINFSVFHYGFDLSNLNKVLEDINGVFVFHFHPSQNNNQMIHNTNGNNNIKFLHYPGDQINELLSRADLLITDYSSLFADFLIFDKPIIFIKFNHEEYVRMKGLFIDYDRDLPGPKVENWPDLISKLNDIFSSNIDEFQSKRKELRKMIYPQLDGNSCDRIVSFAQSIMK